MDAGGLQPQGRPAGHPGAGLGVGREAEAAVLVLGGAQVGDRVRGRESLDLPRQVAAWLMLAAPAVASGGEAVPATSAATAPSSRSRDAPAGAARFFHANSKRVL